MSFAAAGVTLAGLALDIAPPTPARADALDPRKLRGQWTTIPSGDWGGALGKGTHLALLRGSGDSSWVLHFDAHDGEAPRLWLANPETDASLGVDVAPADTDRIFCAGHTTLADGRLLVVGGEVLNHTGPSFAYIFDPKAWWGPGSGWTRQSDMQLDRRYGSATLLPDGRVLVTSGQQDFQSIAYGGLDPAGAPWSDMAPLSHATPPFWSGDPTVARPAARSGHSAVFEGGSGRMIVFGGHDGTAPRNDLWALLRTSVDEGERWQWQSKCDTCVAVRPPARWRHSAVGSGDTMVVFGGLDASGTVLGDVWRWIRSQDRWLPLATSGGPGPRYGHTAVVVPGRADAVPPQHAPQMLVFGGRDASGAIADSAVWALSLPPSGDGLWRLLATGPGPPAREGHVAVLDVTRQRPGEYPPHRRVIVFGGEGRAGLLDDAWLLSRPDLSTSAEEPWSWSTLTPTGGSPAPRSGHAAVHDIEYDRLLVFGGDTNGAAPGGLVNDVWGMNLALLTNPAAWEAVATGDSVPSPRSGHTLAWHPTQTLARVPERFTVADAASPPGIWERIEAPKYLQYYPHLFVLSSGKLFFSGNTFDAISRIFDPVVGAWTTAAPAGFVGSYSVMFRPDTVLKCGSDVFAPGNQTRIAVVDPATSAITWGPIQTMPEARAFQNLVILPTGEVLMTGGRNLSGQYTRNPRLWNSHDERTWSDTLATEPADRQYHSSALLLPDGRVLASGGLPSQTYATVFWPPYLFNDDGTPATRPVITAMPPGGVLDYAATVSVSCDTAEAIGIVCLIRPGSVTHQADFDQRFVRLDFQPTSATELEIHTPVSTRHAPPGDYLLFLVKKHSGVTDSIPSVARWVRLVPDATTDVEPAREAVPLLTLHAVRPNPATSQRVALGFEIPAPSRVQLDVIDVQGRRIRRLIDGPLPPGRHAIDWDLTDEGGRRVRPGVYVIGLRAGGAEARTKAVLLP